MVTTYVLVANSNFALATVVDEYMEPLETGQVSINALAVKAAEGKNSHICRLGGNRSLFCQHAGF